MPGLVPGIHVLLHVNQDVDGRDKPGHDELPLIKPTPMRQTWTAVRTRPALPNTRR